MGIGIGQGQMLRVAGKTGAGDKGRVRPGVKRCNYCGHVGAPRKPFSWKWLLLLGLTGVGAIYYLAFYLLFKRKSCERCGCKDLEPVRVYASV